MFKTTQEISVLGVGIIEPPFMFEAEGLNFATVNSGRRAIDMLRMLRFDLILVGTQLPDISVWEFVRRAKIGWPWQKWALVGDAITDQQEITARMMGVTKIYDVMPSADELAELTAVLREKATKAVLTQNYDNTFEPAKLRSAAF